MGPSGPPGPRPECLLHLECPSHTPYCCSKVCVRFPTTGCDLNPQTTCSSTGNVCVRNIHNKQCCNGQCIPEHDVCDECVDDS